MQNMKCSEKNKKQKEYKNFQPEKAMCGNFQSKLAIWLGTLETE